MKYVLLLKKHKVKYSKRKKKRAVIHNSWFTEYTKITGRFNYSVFNLVYISTNLVKTQW